MKAQARYTLPGAIADFIGDAPLIADQVGESPSRVYHFARGNDVFFLKASAAVYAPTTYSVRREARVLQWLAGHLNVPEVVRVAANADGEFMLTRRVPGVPLRARMDDADTAIGLFGEALRQLRAVPMADCPFDAGAPMRLRELHYLLARGLCADDHDLTQWPGLATPADLVARLHATLPREDPAFSHGDLCDNNVFVDERDRLHFIDLGRGGVADRWQDVAFIHRNLRDISEDAAAAFLGTLDVADDPAKRRFFEQLDELF